MNSLVMGFLYLCGMAWCLCECVMLSVAGNSTPLWLYITLFWVMFGILGCLDLSDRTINGAGAVLAVLLGVSLLIFALGDLMPAIKIGATLGDGMLIAIKLIAAVFFLGLSVPAFLGVGKSEAHAPAHH